MTGRLPAPPPQPGHDPEVELLGPWWTFDAPSLRVADRNREYVSVWSAGDAGRSVLLAAPAAAGHRSWEPLLPGLTEHLVVHAVDLRGPDLACGPDVEGVCTAFAATGAQLVAARGEAASAVLGAMDRLGPVPLVLWEPPPQAAIRTGPREKWARITILSTGGDVTAAVTQLAAATIGPATA